MSHPRTQLQRVGGPDTEDNDRVHHPQTENDRNQKDTDETASWKRLDRPWFALLEFALSVEVPRGIADERDSADCTVTPTGNKTKMNGFVEISTLLIHSAPKQKSNEWMHLSPFYARMHGEWLRYAKSTSQFHWRFLLVRDVRSFQVNPLCHHYITRSDRQIGNTHSLSLLVIEYLSCPCLHDFVVWSLDCYLVFDWLLPVLTIACLVDSFFCFALDYTVRPCLLIKPCIWILYSKHPRIWPHPVVMAKWSVLKQWSFQPNYREKVNYSELFKTVHALAILWSWKWTTPSKGLWFITAAGFTSGSTTDSLF